MHIPQDILRDQRTTPANLAPIITQAAAELECLTEKVASIDERLTLAYAMRRLGRIGNTKQLHDELATESPNLDAARRTLAGLRAIEAYQDKTQAEAREKQEAIDRGIAESRQRAAAYLAEQA